MTGRRRSRPTTPATCTCANARHEHGSDGMYGRHKCGCDTCYDAQIARRRIRSGKPTTPEPAPTAPTIQGLFVAIFPYYGGLTPQRLRRILRMEIAALAEAQSVRLLSGDLRVRTDRTGAGVFVSVAVPAEASAAAVEVQRLATELAWRHEQAHPQLARALSRSLEMEVAA